MKSLSELLNAFAAIAWPAFAFYVFYTLRDELKKLISRLRRGKILGQEIELDEELKQLENTVEQVLESSPPIEGGVTESDRSYRDRILTEADRSALGAFSRVSSDLELLVNQVLARTGWNGGRDRLSVREGFARLPADWTGRDLLRTVDQFSHLRNRIIHESRLITEDEIRRAISIGLTLFEALKSYPIEENRVKDLVDIFRDPAATVVVPGVKGLRMLTKHPQLSDQIRIFPTTRTWYEPGQLLSWEWNPGLTLQACYYRDPDDGTIKQAWGSSMEFVGRPLQDLN